MFEDLEYRYNTTGTGANARLLQNRLYHVNDLVQDGPTMALYGDDIENQGALIINSDNGTPNDLTDDTRIDEDNNYVYSALGELIIDKSEGIEEIYWRTDGKIGFVKRTNSSQKENLGFEYDALGNRIAKHVYSDNTLTVIEKSTYYIRDSRGVVLAIYQYESNLNSVSSYDLIERTIVGASRLGVDRTRISMIPSGDPQSTIYSHSLGLKYFELSNHLGNVLTVISDRKEYITFDGLESGFFESTIVNVSDYSPFGAMLFERSWNNVSFRYGFNGKEVDNEGMGGCSQTYDYGFRIYNPALGRFLSIDPLHQTYPWLSTYQFASNRPIVAIDLDGLEASTTTGADNVTSDPNEVTYQGAAIREVEIVGDLSGWQKFKSFGAGVIKGVATVVVAAVVVTAVAAACVATFGAAAGPIVWGAAAAYGAYSVAKQGTEIVTGKEDWGTGRELTQGEKWERGGELVGGLAVGAKLKLGDKLFGGKGKSNNGAVEQTPKEQASKTEITEIVVGKADEVVEQVGKNFTKISNSHLKKSGIDAHQLKQDFLGKKANISRFDLYKDTKTSEILILQKGGKGDPVNTGEYID